MDVDTAMCNAAEAEDATYAPTADAAVKAKAVFAEAVAYATCGVAAYVGVRARPSGERHRFVRKFVARRSDEGVALANAAEAAARSDPSMAIEYATAVLSAANAAATLADAVKAAERLSAIIVAYEAVMKKA